MGPFQTNDFTSGNGGGTIKVDTEIVGLKVFRENLFIFGKDKIFKLSGTALANSCGSTCNKKYWLHRWW